MITLNWSSFCLLLIFSSITAVIFQQTSSLIIKNNEKNSTALANIRCSRNWFQLNYSCYFLSEQLSIITQANSTCEKLHVEKTSLMLIERPIEFIYAAFVLVKNDLSSLLVQINVNFIKNAHWENIFSSQIVDLQWKLFEEQTRSSKHCDEFQWNVVNDNVDVFILKQKIDSNRTICSLNNLNSDTAHRHLCEYQLDRCLNNDKCGSHGTCINTKLNFSCECSFFYDGQFCQKRSSQHIQLAVAIGITLIFPIDFLVRLIWFLYRKIRDVFQRLKNKNDEKVSEQADQIDENTQSQNIFLFLFEQCNNWIYKHKSVIVLATIFTGILILIPPICYYNFFSNSSETMSSTQNKKIFRWENLVYSIISLGVTIFIMIHNWKLIDPLNQNEKRLFNLICIETMKPFDITNRWLTTAIHLILIFEILDVLDETSIEMRDAISHQIFVKIIVRLIFVFCIGLRYYPLLISLQFKQRSIRVVASIYSLANLIRIIVEDTLHFQYLLFFNQISSYDDQPKIVYEFSLFIYFLKRCLYYCCLATTCSMLILRVINKPKQTNQQYSFKELSIQNNRRENNDENHDANGFKQWLIQKLNQLNRFRKNIYTWENDFRLTTIVVCTYTIAFVVLFHLTFHLMFSYILNQSAYVYSTIKFIERLLETEIPKRRFRRGIIFSALVTILIYVVQLIHSIQNYKNSVRKTYENYQENSNKLKFYSNKNETIENAIRYPALILRYLFGGILICFHLLLFISILGETLFKRTQLLKVSILILILTTICTYRLHQIIGGFIKFVFTKFHTPDRDKVNIKNSSSVLIYFDVISTFLISVVSSVNRLIQTLFVNILFLSRLDYSPFVQPLQSIDSVHSTFQCFIHWEILYRHEVLLAPSSTVARTENPPMNESNAEPSSTESTENTPLAHGTQPQTLAINTDEDSNIFSRDNFN